MGKTIFITGASSGIGKASAIFFQQKGWNVVATMRAPQDGSDLAKRDNVLVTRLDVTDVGSIEAAIEQGTGRFGAIDVVLNNAGFGVFGVFESAKRESIRRQFAVNVLGMIDVTQRFVPHFRKNKGGMFINVSSIGGKVTFPLLPLYHATKFAIEGFSESLWYEMKSIGVGVKIVEPGGVSTDFGGRSLDVQYEPGLAPEYDALMGGMQAAFQEALSASARSTPEQVASAIYEAATDGADTMRYVVGGDAEEMIAARNSMDDVAFMKMMWERFGGAGTP